MKFFVYVVCIGLSLWVGTTQRTAWGQNVSGYEMMPDPTLLLLREPAIHQDLRMMTPQRDGLIEFNETYDAALLSTRNMSMEDGQRKMEQIVKKSREYVTGNFSVAQQQRLRQIMYRLRGISFVLLPSASSQLQLTDDQRSRIETAVKKAFDSKVEAQSGTYQGPDKQKEIQRTLMAARKEEYDTILEILTSDQRQQLNNLVGPQFDQSKLGQVSFAAPDLSGGASWINSEPLTLEDLRGKVVALHFYAFG